jgi:glycerol kinase
LNMRCPILAAPTYRMQYRGTVIGHRNGCKRTPISTAVTTAPCFDERMDRS